MQTINITELENNISAYLEKVRQGSEIVVEANAKPFARILPISDDDAEANALVAAGVLRLSENEELPVDFWDESEQEEIALQKITDAVRAERDEI